MDIYELTSIIVMTIIPIGTAGITIFFNKKLNEKNKEANEKLNEKNKEANEKLNEENKEANEKLNKENKEANEKLFEMEKEWQKKQERIQQNKIIINNHLSILRDLQTLLNNIIAGLCYNRKNLVENKLDEIINLTTKFESSLWYTKDTFLSKRNLLLSEIKTFIAFSQISQNNEEWIQNAKGIIFKTNEYINYFIKTTYE